MKEVRKQNWRGRQRWLQKIGHDIVSITGVVYYASDLKKKKHDLNDMVK